MSDKEEATKFTVTLFCAHCRERRSYAYPKGSRLWITPLYFRTDTLRRTRCGVCGVVGELDR